MFAGLFTYIWEVAAARIESLPLLNFDKDFVENFRFKASNVSIIDGNIPINSVESLPLISSDAISVSTATVAYSLSCKLLAQVLQSASIRTTFHDSGVTVAFLRTINKVRIYLFSIFRLGLVKRFSCVKCFARIAKVILFIFTSFGASSGCSAFAYNYFT